MEECTLDRLLFVPANIPPHKAECDFVVPALHRLAMTRLATQHNPHFGVSDIEIAREGISYTIDTIRQIRKQFNPEKLLLFIGLDHLETFGAWYKSNEVLEESSVVAMLRPSHGLDRVDPSILARVQVLRIPLLEISSTDIRQRLQARKSIRYLVPEAVAEYISDHELYASK